MSKGKKLINQAHAVYDDECSFLKWKTTTKKKKPKHFNHSYTFLSGNNVE